MLESQTEKSFWCLLKTRTRQEKRAKSNLEKQKVEVFCPEINVEIIKNGRVSFSKEILFPGYLFINITGLAIPFSTIKSTRGVKHFISFGNSIAKVPQELMRELQNKLHSSGKVAISRLPRKGDKLLVSRGSFKGVNVIFSQPDGEKRAIVLMNIMNQEIQASIEFSNLSLINY